MTKFQDLPSKQRSESNLAMELSSLKHLKFPQNQNFRISLLAVKHFSDVLFFNSTLAQGCDYSDSNYPGLHMCLLF